MKNKFILLIVFILSINITLNANDDIKNKIKEIRIFKSDSVHITDAVKNGLIYHVAGFQQGQNGQKPFDAFVTKDLKIVILGKGFNVDNGQELFIPKNMEYIKKEAAFTIGSGKEDLYLFTDPECPYCIELEKNINANLTKEKLEKIKIHVILFPLPFHKNAKNMSYYILSKKSNEERYKAIKEIMLNRDASYMKASHTVSDLEKYNKQLKEQMDIVKELGVNGTPTILDSKGKKINPAQLFR